MRLLVFQHIPVEHPGIFRDFLAGDDIEWDAVELDAGETIPDLAKYEMLWVMGGPQDVWQDAEFPWLAAEKTAIRDWVNSGRPFLGLCLGHQLLADAMGGRVGPMDSPEVGLCRIDLTDDGKREPLLRGFPEHDTCFQWHGAAVLDAPEAAEVLVSSPACPIQAIRYGPHAYGLQYHVEITDRTVAEWSAVPKYAASLETTLGPGAAARLEAETAQALPGLNTAARRLYDNLMAIVRR